MKMRLSRRAVAEFLGTAFLVTAVVGSGIMGERLAAGNMAITLLVNTLATGAALVALILTFGSISGAHFNPVVTLADACESGLRWAEAPHYVVAQIIGGISGAIVANLMFGLPVVSVSQHAKRPGPMVQGVCSDIWSGLGDLGLFPVTVQRGSLCRGCLYHGSILVHCVYCICESRCNNCKVS